MNTLLNRYKILSSSKIGIEFEFFSEFSMKEVTRSLSRTLGKKIVIPSEVVGLGEKEKGTYHSDLEPTSNLFKLEKDFSGGKDMFETITGPMAYEEARIVIIKTLQWIAEFGWTNEKCSIHLNISFNEFLSPIKIPVMNLNVLKFILSFDEDFIYSRFPSRKDSVYAKSIFNIYPLSRFIFFENPENIDRYDYIVPHEKYYGVNFTKLPKNYLEFRYVGGENYEKKTNKILDILDYCILQLHSCLAQGNNYTPQEQEKLYKTLTVQKKAVLTFSDPEKFLLTYPKLIITIDMKGEIEILKAYWTAIRDKLFSLVVDSGLREGHFNFDTDISIFQLRDGIMRKANHIEGMELFDCEISGTINECVLYRCKLKSSRLDKCKLIEANEVYKSKVENTTIMQDNLLYDCYVNNPNELIDGKMIGGVIRKGIIGKNADISKSTLIVESKEGGDKKDNESYMNAFSKNNKPSK